jgi:transcription initiation factor TFIID subunit 12
MNSAGQGQPVSQPGAVPGQVGPGGQAAGAPQRLPMYRPEMMRNMPFLSDEDKGKYERGLRQLWTQYEGSAADTPQHLEAKRKIAEFSKMLMGKLQARRMAAQGQMQQQQQQQNQANQAAQAAQAAAAAAAASQRPAPEAHDASTATAANNNATPNPAAPVSAPPAPSAPVEQAPIPMPVPTIQPTQPGQQPVKIPEHILQHVNRMTFHPLPAILEKGAEAAQKWCQEMKQKYVRALMTMDNTRQRVQQIDGVVRDREQKGNPFSQDELKALQIRKDQQQKMYQEAHKFVESFRKQQEALSKVNPAQGAAGTAPRPAPPNGTPVTSAVPGTAAQVAGQQTANPALQNPQAVTATVNAAVEAAKPQQNSVTAVGRPPVPNGMAAPTQTASTPTSVTPIPPPSIPSHAAPTATSVAPPLKTDPPLPPPVNTALASAAAAAAGQLPSAGTPTQNSARAQTPQSATPVTGPARALSHQAAILRANQRVSSQPASTPVAGQTSAGTPGSAGAVGQGVMGSGIGTPQQGHPAVQPTQPSALQQSKLPIPKTLPDKATQVPQAVTMGGGVAPGRPTYTTGSGTAGGVTGQVAINKVPTYHHESEGDHVLSKKKLDELVRQVCGGTAEGQEGNLLTPEVEEVSETEKDSHSCEYLDCC